MTLDKTDNKQMFDSNKFKYKKNSKEKNIFLFCKTSISGRRAFL